MLKPVGIAAFQLLVVSRRFLGIVVESRRHFAADVAQPIQAVVMFRFHRLSPAVAAGSRARASAAPATHSPGEYARTCWHLPDVCSSTSPTGRNDEMTPAPDGRRRRSEERRVGKECRSRWS